MPEFVHEPGRHCSSTSLRDLFGFYGADLPEGVLFGLAAGASFYSVALPGISPSRIISGRAARLEHQLLEIAPGYLELTESDDPSDSWSFAKQQIDAERPALLLTDLYYLEYYNSSTHFSGHAVVLAGYDDEFVYLADTERPGLQREKHAGLAKARHSQAPPIPLKGEMFTIRDPDKLDRLQTELPELCTRAIGYAADRMLNPEVPEAQGIPALRRWAAEVARWPQEAEDWKWCTRFAYQVIERRGTGGGNFRGLYAEFLEFAAEREIGDGLDRAAEQCAQLATDWTELALALKDASEADEPESQAWIEIAEQVEDLALGEEKLWQQLAESVSQTHE